MAWLSSVWKRRLAITIDNSTAATPADAQGNIPKDLIWFWSVIDTSGNELRVTAADGVTALTYDIVASGGGAFSKTNKDGRIDIDGMTMPATNSMVLAWLYYDSTSNQGDASSAVVIAAPRALYIEHGNPARDRYAMSYAPAYATRPRWTKPKFPAEVRQIFLAMRRALRERIGSQRLREEVWYASQGVVDSAGANAAALYTLSALRFVTDESDRKGIWVMATIQAGTDNAVYTLNFKVYTVLPYGTALNQTFQQAIGFRVDELFLTS